jgi:hypothetical protein
MNLRGAANFIEWSNTLLTDAHLIRAEDILLKAQHDAPIEATQMERFLWSERSEALYTRMVQSFSSTVITLIGRDHDRTAAGWIQARWLLLA